MDNDFKFGTVGSPTSTPKKPGGSVGAIQQIHSLDLNALELGWVQSVRVTEDTCKIINQASVEFDVLLSVHAPYFINLNADDEEWPKSKKRLMDAAKFGNLAGATDVIFHPGSYFNQPADEVIPIVVKRLNECVSETRSMGNPIVFRPETMGKGSMIGSIDDVLEMSRHFDGVEPCLDFAHLHARAGDGSINDYEAWSGILEKYEKILGKGKMSSLHIHLSGIEYTSKGEKKHLPLLESDLNLEDLFKALKDSHCGGRIVCESPILEQDAVLLRNMWSG